MSGLFLARGVLSRGFLSGGLCPGGFCLAVFCPDTGYLCYVMKRYLKVEELFRYLFIIQSNLFRQMVKIQELNL